MTVFGFAGIHQVVTATVMLVLFGALPLGLSHLALMEAVLLGWAFTSMTGLSAVSVAAASTMFGVPLERVAYGPNIRFCLAFGVIGVAVGDDVDRIDDDVDHGGPPTVVPPLLSRRSAATASAIRHRTVINFEA